MAGGFASVRAEDGWNGGKGGGREVWVHGGALPWRQRLFCFGVDLIDVRHQGHCPCQAVNALAKRISSSADAGDAFDRGLWLVVFHELLAGRGHHGRFGIAALDVALSRLLLAVGRLALASRVGRRR